MPKRFPRKRRSTQRRSQLQPLETRQMMAADSIGVTPQDTGEFLLGTVGVTPVFLESDGSIDPESQDWSAAEIDEVLAKVTEGVNWWSDTLDTLNTVHTLDFVVDDTYARTPFETPFEPIDRSTNSLNEYIGDFVTRLGYGDARSIEEAVQRFNQDQRIKLGTDWAFTIFVVDSSDDPDGLFKSGGNFSAAFAYAGGLFIVTPSTRPASTIAHEMGHIFWARDEYQGGSSWTDQRGYYDTQALNAADNPTPGFYQEISIMRGGVPLTAAYDANVSPESTLAMVGWQDTDGDGIFDVADVPLQLDGIGYFDAEESIYHFNGTASAVPLINKNSSGVQSDITLGRISELQYQLDDGPWSTAVVPDAQAVTLDVDIPIDQLFSDIRIRVIDVATGVVSPTIVGSSAVAAISQASVMGVAFLDENADGLKDLSESPLLGTTVTVTKADGSPLDGGSAAASSFAEGVIPVGQLSGFTIAADGVVSNPEVGSFLLTGSSDLPVFESFDLQRSEWTPRWSSKVAFTAAFDEAVGDVSVLLVGLDDASYGRIEAYDAAGGLITRQTSSAITTGQTTTLRVVDPRGSIASIRVFGHAGSSVAISQIDFGINHSLPIDSHLEIDPSGAFRLANLPDGNYLVQMSPELVIHSFGDDPIPVSVVGGTSPLIQAAATRVDSPRHNPLKAEDSNRDGEVTAGDALLIINDLSRYQSRVLSANETEGFSVDVNNDGSVTAIDVLLVINALGRSQGSAAGEQLSQNELTDVAISQWDDDVPLVNLATDSSPESTNRTLLSVSPQSESSTKVTRMFNFDGGNAVDDREAVLVADRGNTPISSGDTLPKIESRKAGNPRRQDSRETVAEGPHRGKNVIFTALSANPFVGIESKLTEPLGDSAV